MDSLHGTTDESKYVALDAHLSRTLQHGQLHVRSLLRMALGMCVHWPQYAQKGIVESLVLSIASEAVEWSRLDVGSGLGFTCDV